MIFSMARPHIAANQLVLRMTGLMALIDTEDLLFVKCIARKSASMALNTPIKTEKPHFTLSQIKRHSSANSGLGINMAETGIG